MAEALAGYLGEVKEAILTQLGPGALSGLYSSDDLYLFWLQGQRRHRGLGAFTPPIDAPVDIQTAIIMSLAMYSSPPVNVAPSIDESPLAAVAPTTTALEVAFTVPEGPPVSASVQVVNTSPDPITVTVAMAPAGEAADPAHEIAVITVPPITIDAPEPPKPIPVGILAATDEIRVQTSSADDALFTILKGMAVTEPPAILNIIDTYQPPDTAMNVIHEVPAGPAEVIKAVMVSNQSADPIQAKLAVAMDGAAFADQHQIQVVTVPALTSSFPIPVGAVFMSGATIGLQTSAVADISAAVVATPPDPVYEEPQYGGGGEDMVSIVYEDGSSYYGPSGSAYDAGAGGGDAVAASASTAESRQSQQSGFDPSGYYTSGYGGGYYNYGYSSYGYNTPSNYGGYVGSYNPYNSSGWYGSGYGPNQSGTAYYGSYGYSTLMTPMPGLSVSGGFGNYGAGSYYGYGSSSYYGGGGLNMSYGYGSYPYSYGYGYGY